MKLNNQSITLILLILYALFRVLMFNVNKTEIGDSYNLITASDAIRDGTYTENEKRMPLYPILLASRIG